MYLQFAALSGSCTSVAHGYAVAQAPAAILADGFYTLQLYGSVWNRLRLH